MDTCLVFLMGLRTAGLVLEPGHQLTHKRKVQLLAETYGSSLSANPAHGYLF